ncbi:hypothetical protein LEMLEM_LOCUS22689 [Lemmus lemmus]
MLLLEAKIHCSRRSRPDWSAQAENPHLLVSQEAAAAARCSSESHFAAWWDIPPADSESQGPAHRLTRRRGGAGLGGVTSLVGGAIRRRRKLAVAGRRQNQESGFPRSPERGAGRRRVAKPGARKPLLSLTQRLGTKQPPSAQRRARSDPRRSL